MTKSNLTAEEIEFLSESNKIEGESGEMNSMAMEDAIKAWEYAKKEIKKSKGQLDMNILLGVHERLLKRLAPHYKGKIRDGCSVYIGGEVKNQSKGEIIGDLNELFDTWNKIENALKNIKEFKQEEYIKKWHIQYEGIHAFSDGNGRSGRILMNLQRLKLGLPLLIIYDKEKTKYYAWFKENSEWYNSFDHDKK